MTLAFWSDADVSAAGGSGPTREWEAVNEPAAIPTARRRAVSQSLPLHQNFQRLLCRRDLKSQARLLRLT